MTEEEPVIITARNDGMINPIQLSAWRANVDMQYIVSRNRVVQYCTKYVSKSDTRSVFEGYFCQSCSFSKRRQKNSQSSSEAPHQHLWREGLFSTGNLSPSIAAPHVQGIKEFHDSQS